MEQQHQQHQQHVNRLLNGLDGGGCADSGNGSLASAPASRCWASMGSVDVEDLALFFGDSRENNGTYVSKSYANPNHRVFRNRNGPVTIATSATLRNSEPYVQQFNDSIVNHTDSYYGCEYESRCYLECVQNAYPDQHQQGDYSTWRYQTDNKKIRRLNGHAEHELPLDVGLPCTEEQWLACPANNCPVFDNVSSTSVAPTTTWNDSSINQNSWSLYENRTNFGHVLPPCMSNDTYFDINAQNNVYSGCYPRWEAEQQFFEDYLSNEKRKEKSRDAARCRRSRETDIFTELAGALPLEPDQATHLDKASVMRLAIAYLKVRSVIDSLEKPITKTEKLTDMDAFFPKALDGFMLVLSNNGDMVYLSENVSDYLGVSQMDMMGQSVYEYSHPCDHDELRECLSMNSNDVKEKRPCNFFLRLKCTLTSKGRKVNLKSATYKVIHCTGRTMGTFDSNAELRSIEGAANNRDGDSSDSQSSDERDSDIGNGSGFGYSGASLVIVGCPIPHPSNIEVPLGQQTFLSKHSLNMKFTYADDRLAEYLGWSSNELLGKSVFEFHHALDNAALDKSFKTLFSKGQCETTAYRFLGKTGGYAWVVTQATLIHCSKQHKPLSVVCVNHILSGIECEDEVYSQRQLKARKAASVNDRTVISAAEDFEAEDSLNLQSLPSLVLETPSATNTDDSLDGEDEEELERGSDGRESKASSVISAEYSSDASILKTPSYKAECAKPRSVTAAIFKSQANLESQANRKEQSVAPKVVKNSDNRRERPTYIFQGKPILEYEQSRYPRPQTVTKSLFVTLDSIQDADTEEPPQYEQTTTSRPTPQTATASIFAPRTEDMNTGFLTYSEDQSGFTMRKDEPEDLTHLAPTPGDVCVPLQDTPFLSDDMLDEFILGNENYCPLLSSDLGDNFSKDNPDIGESLESSLADGDPFIYRDIPSPCSLSPNLLSPADTASVSGVSLGNSPDQSSVNSLQTSKHNDIIDGMISIGSASSVGNPITEDEMLMLSINDVIADDELALRAPYIPMSDQDEALQLLISDDTVMWGPSQPPDKKPKWYHDDEEKPHSKRYDDSSLARLLKTDTSPTKYNDHGGGLVDPAEIFGQINKGNSGSKLERPSKRVHATISPSVPNESKRSRFQESRMPITVMPGGVSPAGLPSGPQSAARSLNSGNYEEQSIDLCGVLAAEEKLEPAGGIHHQRGGSQLLLQQLMSRDDDAHATGMTKSRSAATCPKPITGDCVSLVSIVDADIAAVTASPSVERKKIKMGSSGSGGGMEPTTDPATRRGQRQSNSVLMNLLVSGCDKASGLTMPQHVIDKWSPMIVDERTDSRLVPTNNRTELAFFNEYSAVNPAAISAQIGGFENYFNGDNAVDTLMRTNLSEAATISVHSRYVK